SKVWSDWATRETGFWEGMIPVYGPFRSSVYHYARDECGWGTFNFGMTVVDVTGVGYVGRAGLGSLRRVASRLNSRASAIARSMAAKSAAAAKCTGIAFAETSRLWYHRLDSLVSWVRRHNVERFASLLRARGLNVIVGDVSSQVGDQLVLRKGASRRE